MSSTIPFCLGWNKTSLRSNPWGSRIQSYSSCHWRWGGIHLAASLQQSSDSALHQCGAEIGGTGLRCGRYRRSTSWGSLRGVSRPLLTASPASPLQAGNTGLRRHHSAYCATPRPASGGHSGRLPPFPILRPKWVSVREGGLDMKDSTWIPRLLC